MRNSMYVNKPCKTRCATQIREEQELIKLYKIVYAAISFVFLLSLIIIVNN